MVMPLRKGAWRTWVSAVAMAAQRTASRKAPWISGRVKAACGIREGGALVDLSARLNLPDHGELVRFASIVIQRLGEDEVMHRGAGEVAAQVSLEVAAADFDDDAAPLTKSNELARGWDGRHRWGEDSGRSSAGGDEEWGADDKIGVDTRGAPVWALGVAMSGA
jgi:hypothetical protein